ncbi:cory-CC-star protein [Campylobacter sp.]|uniref:cory-CC-star protein n=1 Tax=Campylobacter sp. TaxID=205 RepID=UPI0026FBE271|nr:cory-CC-star protein [Campylobacter sp.]
MKEQIKAFFEGLSEYYNAPYRSALTKSYQEENDFFMLMVFAESLGIENPTTFYTMEILPFLLEEFHSWHRRMGMQSSPIEHFGCC